MRPTPLVSFLVAEAPERSEIHIVVGQNSRGHRVVVEAGISRSGLLRTRSAAFHHAADLADHRLNAIVVSTDALESRLGRHVVLRSARIGRPDDLVR